MGQSELIALVPVASAAIALLSLVISASSLRTSRKAVRISQAQEDRRAPKISIYLKNCYIRRAANGDRLYAFSITLANQSDTSNSIISIDLRVEYLISPTEPLLLKIGLLDRIPKGEEESSEHRIGVPLRLDAHCAASGWCFFKLPAMALAKEAIIKHTIIAATDSYGTDVTIEPILVSEINE